MDDDAFGAAVVWSPRNLQYMTRMTTDRTVRTPEGHLCCRFPPEPIPQSQFQDQHKEETAFMVWSEDVVELQLFYDSRIPGWELATSTGDVGGNRTRYVRNGSSSSSWQPRTVCNVRSVQDGRTVRQEFRSVFGKMEVVSDHELLPRFLTAQLCPMYVYHLQLTLTVPSKLYLTDVFFFLANQPMVYSVSPESTPFKWRKPTLSSMESSSSSSSLSPYSVRSMMTGESTQVWSQFAFSRQFLHTIPPKLLFRYLCLRSVSKGILSEYVALFPKHKKCFRICRYAISTWIHHLWSSYRYVHVFKTKSMGTIVPASMRPHIKYLHTEVYCKRKQTITFAVIVSWLLQHPEDALMNLLE